MFNRVFIWLSPLVMLVEFQKIIPQKQPLRLPYIMMLKIDKVKELVVAYA